MSKKIKKKIHPKDQTEELNKARYEFMKRNPDAKISLYERMDYYQPPLYGEAASDFRFLLGESLDKVISNMFVKGTYQDYIDANTNRPSKEWFYPEWREQILKDAKYILNDIIPEQPSSIALIRIDLERTKEAIMAELEVIVTIALAQYQQFWSRIPVFDRLGNIIDVVGDIKKERLKWLEVYEEWLEVYDLHKKAGQQPSRKTFLQISRKVGRPLSTVKSQWRLAYENIFGKKYEPEVKYATEEKLMEATKLCAKCPHGAKCYRRGEQYPCSEYLAIAGKQKNIKLSEYSDSVLYDKQLGGPDE